MAETSRDLEHWLPVVGYEGLYRVSDQGRMFSEARIIQRSDQTTARRLPRALMSRVDDQGYVIVALTQPGHPSRQRRVHRLVLAAFVGPCPPDHEGCHRNGDSSDNRLDNLYWGTKSDNMLDQVRHGVHFRANLTHCPQGHELVAPNLVESLARQGKRKCWSCVTACRRAIETAKYRGVQIDKRVEADRLYVLRMAGGRPRREPFDKSIMVRG